MDIRLNVDVHCLDGRCGRTTYLILNPVTERLTHLVVKEQWPSRLERLVPIEWVVTTARDVIVLKQTRDEFTQLEPFTQTEFVYRDVPHLASDPKVTLFWPYVVPSKRVVDLEVRRIPPDELAIKRGTAVMATDGKIGTVDEFVVDAVEGYISHLVLRDGNLLGTKEVIIPVSQIDFIEGGSVYLNVAKEVVKALPSFKIKRRWG
jgi:sporulation protein YlmC with PRC-barrel domain